MSSSKVFKDDPSFTPITLIQEEIQANGGQREVPECDDALRPPAEAVGEAEVAEIPPAPEPEPVEAPEPVEVDIEAIRQEAYDQGVRDAREKIRDEVRQVLSSFRQACQDLVRLHSSILEQSRGDMINLVIALSRKIIGLELRTGRDTIAATLQAAVDHAIASDEYVIILHPDDLAQAREMEPALVESVRGLKHIVFRTSSEITRGGCRLESNTCAVDATIEAQLETAREFLEQEVSNLEGLLPGPDDDTPSPAAQESGQPAGDGSATDEAP
ncbi:MAG TPA: hypothetical protein ENI89_03700 [Desulfobulbus sp.]|nr:hypothetical protein [Desulfobulbus sp.]